MFTGGCLFIDHASNFVHVKNQCHLNTHETIKAKEAFEVMCRDHGVIPQSYLSDNGKAFTSAGFTSHLSQFEQVMKFAGVGAHHHNGNAERAIQTIMSIARTMMLHSAIHWPDVADPMLWPMAVQHAVFLHNHVADDSTGLSPSNVFTRTRWPQRKLHDLHVWGCPVYVLEKAMADGQKLPRWKPRAHRAVNMGLSPQHASTVPLVLNPEQGQLRHSFTWSLTIGSPLLRRRTARFRTLTRQSGAASLVSQPSSSPLMNPRWIIPSILPTLCLGQRKLTVSWWHVQWMSLLPRFRFQWHR